jgi:uncharacterized protein (TIGR03083 family)
VADLETAYVETYEHMLPILRDLTPEQLQLKVPFSPEWSVVDVVAHMASEAGAFTGHADIPVMLFELSEARRVARVTEIDAFNAAHVAQRRGRPLDELLAEWDGYLPALRAQLRGERPFPSPTPGQDYAAVGDLAMHTQDIRNLVGRPGDRESARRRRASAPAGTSLSGHSPTGEARLRFARTTGREIRSRTCRSSRPFGRATTTSSSSAPPAMRRSCRW